MQIKLELYIDKETITSEYERKCRHLKIYFIKLKTEFDVIRGKKKWKP